MKFIFSPPGPYLRHVSAGGREIPYTEYTQCVVKVGGVVKFSQMGKAKESIIYYNNLKLAEGQKKELRFNEKLIAKATGKSEPTVPTPPSRQEEIQ